MKRRLIIILGIVVIFAGIILVRVISGEDSWFCEDGQWIKHGNPTASMPTEPCR